jgi:hypothetical protein
MCTRELREGAPSGSQRRGRRTGSPRRRTSCGCCGELIRSVRMPAPGGGSRRYGRARAREGRSFGRAQRMCTRELREGAPSGSQRRGSGPAVRAGGLRVVVAANSFALSACLSRADALCEQGFNGSGRRVPAAWEGPSAGGEILRSRPADCAPASFARALPQEVNVGGGRTGSPRRRTSCGCCGEFIRFVRMSASVADALCEQGFNGSGRTVPVVVECPARDGRSFGRAQRIVYRELREGAPSGSQRRGERTGSPCRRTSCGCRGGFIRPVRMLASRRANDRSAADIVRRSSEVQIAPIRRGHAVIADRRFFTRDNQTHHSTG